MQDTEITADSYIIDTTIGGLQKLKIPLYDASQKPLWYQNDTHIPHLDLNGINIFVPVSHDAVKIELPSDIRISDTQLIEERDSFVNTISLGDKLYIVGYPYGYSAYGSKQPTPIVLTRYVASLRIDGRVQEVLLESPGAPSMSGSPVFIERDSEVKLFGLYTGLIYPDHIIETSEKYTALGTCADMTIFWRGQSSLVLNPSQSVDTKSEAHKSEKYVERKLNL